METGRRIAEGRCYSFSISIPYGTFHTYILSSFFLFFFFAPNNFNERNTFQIRDSFVIVVTAEYEILCKRIITRRLVWLTLKNAIRDYARTLIR